MVRIHWADRMGEYCLYQEWLETPIILSEKMLHRFNVYQDVIERIGEAVEKKVKNF